MTAPTTEATTVAAFVAERCRVGLRYSVRFVNLRGAFILWCLHNRVPHGEDVEAWELDLQRSIPEFLTITDADGESWRYVGLGLKP